MNNIENFSQERSFNNYKTNLKRVLAGTAASVIAFSSAGCGLNANENNSGSQTLVTAPLYTHETIGTSSLEEPSITEPPYTRETNPPKRATTQESYPLITEPPYTRETNPLKRPWATESVVTSVSTEIDNKYDLSKVAPERREFTKDLLVLYDNCANDQDSPSNIQKYLNPNQIIKYGETGNGLEIIKDKRNQPAIALINCDKDTINSLRIAIQNLEKIDSYAVSRLSRNGIKAIVNTDLNGQDSISNKDGLLTIQYKKDRDIDPKQDYRLTIDIARESFSISAKQLGGKFESQNEILSSLLLSNCFWYQYQKTGEKVYKALSYYNYAPYQTYRNSHSLAAEEIQSMVKDIQENNLIEAYGATWDEINNSTHNRIDWHIGATM